MAIRPILKILRIFSRCTHHPWQCQPALEGDLRRSMTDRIPSRLDGDYARLITRHRGSSGHEAQQPQGKALAGSFIFEDR